MRIFFAGATGVLGRYALPLLLEAGHDITAAARSPEKRAWLDQYGARAIVLDLFDAVAVRRAVNGAEAIINLATAVPAAGAGMVLPWAWHGMDRVRRQVSANLADAALAGGTVGRLIQESFAPIYADGGDAWLDESAPVHPARYNRAAVVAEGQADRMTRAGRVGVVLRFGMLYGPGDAATEQMIASVRRGWYPLVGRPSAYSSWVAHSDAGSAVSATLRVPAGAYNVVEDAPMRRRDLANGLAGLLGARPPRFLPVWAKVLGGVLGGTMARSLRVSNRRLRAASGWSPRHATTLDGLAAILAAGGA